MKWCVCGLTGCVTGGGGGYGKALRGRWVNWGFVGGVCGIGYRYLMAGVAEVAEAVVVRADLRWCIVAKNGLGINFPSTNVAVRKLMVFCAPMCCVKTCASTTVWRCFDSCSIQSCLIRSFSWAVFCSFSAAALLSHSSCLTERSCSLCTSSSVRLASSSASYVRFSSISVSIWFIHTGMSAVRVRNIVKIWWRILDVAINALTSWSRRGRENLAEYQCLRWRMVFQRHAS